MGWRILAGVAVAAVCIGCGGGGGSGEQTITIPTSASLDGQIAALSGANDALGFATVGDDSGNQEIRAAAAP